MDLETLKKKKISELREIAKAYKIPKPYQYKKDELIDVLIKGYKEENIENTQLDKSEIDFRHKHK